MSRWGERLFNALTFGAAPPPDVTAAAGQVALARGAGRSGITLPFTFGPPLAPFDMPPGAWLDRDTAMTLPTIQRAHDLIVSAVSALPFMFWSVDLSQVPAVERRVPPPSWIDRPDPDRTRQWLLAWTTDDLFFHGVSHWEITARYATTFPSAFRRIWPGNFDQTEDPAWTTVTDPDGTRRRVRARDIVEFLSPLEGILRNGGRPISIALQLDGAAERFSSAEVPAGWLQEKDGAEPAPPEVLAEQAETFSLARHLNTTAAVNQYLEYHESTIDPSRLQLVEGRTYQALELARLGNIPPYLVGAPAGTGMTYLNGQQARQDLVDFGAAPMIGCIEQTLSGPNVTPRGTVVRLDLNAWLRNPFTTPATGAESPTDLQIADQPPSEVPA